MSKKNKKYSDSRLREIALMLSHGLPTKLIAELTGLPYQSVANICGIYKWSPEMLDEITERVKLSGKIGGYARVDLRKYFIMHPEQRPAPHLQLFSEDQNTPDLAAKDRQIDRLKEELAAQRRTLGLLSARVEALENHRQDLSWRVSKQEQNQIALIYAEKSSVLSAEQVKSLSDKVGELGERVDEIDRSVDACDYFCFIRSALEMAKAANLDPEIINGALERIPLIYLHITSHEFERVTGEKEW